MMTWYSICLKYCARQTFYRTKTTLPLDVRGFTGLTDPRCKVSNIFCSIAFLVNSYLTSIKYVMHFVLIEMQFIIYIVNIDKKTSKWQIEDAILPVANDNFIVVPVFNPSTNSTALCSPLSINRFILLCQREEFAVPLQLWDHVANSSYSNVINKEGEKRYLSRR